MRRTTTLLIATLLLASVAAADRSVHETRPCDDNASVSIENIAGSIDVRSWDRDELEVKGTLGSGVEELDIDGSGRRIRIDVEYRHTARHASGAELVIRVPAGIALDVESVSASIEVTGLTGALELESISGTITVHGRPTVIEAASVSGDVTVEHAGSHTELASVSGDVVVGTAEGHLEAANVSGDIEIRGGALDGAELETVSGSIVCAADLVGRGSVELESMSGSVELVIPETVAASFELSTFSGSIRSDLGPPPTRTSRYTPGEEASFSTGADGPRVTMASFSGTVKLRTR